MAPDNTTRQGDIPGGLGLQIVRQFIRLNRGKLIVMSNDGFWMQSGERVSKRRLPLAFPGICLLWFFRSTLQTDIHIASTPPNPKTSGERVMKNVTISIARVIGGGICVAAADGKRSMRRSERS